MHKRLPARLLGLKLVTRIERIHGDILNRVAVGSRENFGLVLVGPACRWRMTIVRTPALHRRLVNFCATGRFVNRAL
ncbi:hypothetical protein [Aquipseudomonas alcaligenes]|uniref:Uncharacterized protein n=1 Tax=Aquipseudomonas alcaligenes TaxID=43263 RepID=A0AA42N0C8_AQUAC|nr:hypothetical protein [Pseudomonas alcaligenes]MDH1054184.1 hypothetical protein [Pseudomonas alcaligenes]